MGLGGALQRVCGRDAQSQGALVDQGGEFGEAGAVRFDYELTAIGRGLLPILGAVKEWSERHIEEVMCSRDAYDARTDGADTEAQASPATSSATGRRRPV